MLLMIEVKGENGESILHDGNFVMKMRHFGKQESARNPATTYREYSLKVKEKKGVREYELVLACQAFFALTFTEESKPSFDEVIAALEAQQTG